MKGVLLTAVKKRRVLSGEAWCATKKGRTGKVLNWGSWWGKLGVIAETIRNNFYLRRGGGRTGKCGGKCVGRGEDCQGLDWKTLFKT